MPQAVIRIAQNQLDVVPRGNCFSNVLVMPQSLDFCLLTANVPPGSTQQGQPNKSKRHQTTSKANPKKLNCLAVDQQDPQAPVPRQPGIRQLTAHEARSSDVSPERLGGVQVDFILIWLGGVQVDLILIWLGGVQVDLILIWLGGVQADLILI